jgi:hypothetical protein
MVGKPDGKRQLWKQDIMGGNNTKFDQRKRVFSNAEF